MSKLVVSGMSPKELRASLSASRGVITETKRQLAAETKVLSFKIEADKNRERLGKQVKSLINSFEKYTKRVVEVGNKKVPLTTIITPEVVNGLVKPFKSYLENEFNSPHIEAAIERLNEKRIADKEKYAGRREGIEAEIDDYYNSKINLYLKPLQFIEAQLRSFAFTKDAVKELPSIETRITRYLTDAEPAKVVDETTDSGEEMPNLNAEDAEKIRSRRRGKKSEVTA